MNGFRLPSRRYAQQFELWFYAAQNGNLPFIKDQD